MMEVYWSASGFIFGGFIKWHMSYKHYSSSDDNVLGYLKRPMFRGTFSRSSVFVIFLKWCCAPEQCAENCSIYKHRHPINQFIKAYSLRFLFGPELKNNPGCFMEKKCVLLWSNYNLFTAQCHVVVAYRVYRDWQISRSFLVSFCIPNIIFLM